jgi:hypothetical protein
MRRKACTLEQATPRQLELLYRSLYDRISSDYRDKDWRTLFVLYPTVVMSLYEISEELRSRAVVCSQRGKIRYIRTSDLFA